MKIARGLVMLLLVLFGSSCESTIDIETAIFNKYGVKKSRNEYEVILKRNHDTVFLSYYFAFDNGSYLNYPADTSDYAGYFFVDSIRNNEVTFRIKDYREFWNDTSRVYHLNLKFLPDSSLKWHIDGDRYGLLSYLPNEIVFETRSTSNLFDDSLQ